MKEHHRRRWLMEHHHATPSMEHRHQGNRVLLVFVILCTAWDFPTIFRFFPPFWYFGGKLQQIGHMT